MADNAIEQLLLKLGLDLSPLKDAGAQIKAVLGDLKTLNADVISQAKSLSAEQKAQLEGLKSGTDAVVAAAKQAIANEQVRAATAKATTAELQIQATQQKTANETTRAAIVLEQAKQAAIKTETAEHLKLLAQKKEETAEIQKQIAELRKKTLEEKEERGGEGGRGFFGTIAGAVLGKGLAGSIAGGLLAGEGIKVAVEGLAHFIEKMKEMQDESSKVVLVTDRFNALARGVGTDGVEMMDQLREATEGLVNRLTLAQFGTRALQANIKGFTPDKIVELTGAVVKLAESAGRVNATQAVEQLGSAISRGGQRAAFTIAQITGLTREQLQLANLSPVMNRVERDAASLTHALAVVVAEAAKLGEAPRTLAQAADQLAVVNKDLVLSFSKGFIESPGTQAVLEMIANFTKHLHSFEETAEEIGRKVGEAFAYVTVAAKSLYEIVKSLLSVVGALGDIFESSTGKAASFGSAFVIVGAVMTQITLAVQYAADAVKVLISVLTHGSQLILDLFTLTLAGLANAGKEIQHIKNSFGSFATDTKEAQDRVAELMLTAQKLEKLAEGSDKSIKPESPDETNQKELNKLIELREKFSEAMARLLETENKNQLAAQKDAIQRERELNQNKYDDGLEELAEYLSRQKELIEKDRVAKTTEAEQNRDAELIKLRAERAKIDAQLQGGQITPREATLQKNKLLVDEASANQKYQAEIVKANSDAEHAIYQANRQAAKDDQAARRTESQERLQLAQEEASHKLKIEKERIETEQKLLQAQLKGGEITPDEYFNHRIKQIEAIAAAEISHAKEVEEAKKKAAEEVFESGTKSPKTQAVRDKAIKEAAQQGVDAVTEATQRAVDQLKTTAESIPSERLSAIQGRYQPQQQALQERLAYEQSEIGNREKLLELNQRLQASYAQQRDELEQIIQSPDVEKYSNDWYKIYDDIEKTYQSQVKLNLELQKMRDAMPALAQGFETIGKSIQQNFQSKFAQNLAGLVQAGAQSIKDSTHLGQVISGKSNLPIKSPEQIKLEQEATELFSNANKGSEVLVTKFDSLSVAVDKATGYINKLAGGTGVVTEGQAQGGDQTTSIDTSNPSQVATYKVNNSPGAGGFATKLGALADKFGAAIQAIDGFVASILSAKSALGGAAGGAVGGLGLGNTVSQAFGIGGPWGQLAGAVVGGVLGAVVGSKNAQVKANIDKMNTEYKQLMQQFALNTNNLNDTIVQLEGLMAQAQILQSSSKKGSSQYQQLIDQYYQQILSLQAQQHQLMVQLGQQLAIVTAPLGDQSTLGDLQSIIEQYRKFEGAAQTTQDLANATQFLISSLKQYDQQVATQYNQNQEQAINDALQLNDLLYQRTQLIAQVNDQIQSILNQGVLTREPTRAQTAGQQIERLQAQTAQQLAQMNEQIAAASYRVDAEKQIFNLANTRIGLETQLLTVQNAQAALQIAQIDQLAKFYAALQSGDFSGVPNLSALLAAIPGSTTPAGTAPISVEAILNLLFAGSYNNRASLGLGTFTGANL